MKKTVIKRCGYKAHAVAKGKGEGFFRYRGQTCCLECCESMTPKQYRGMMKFMGVKV